MTEQREIADTVGVSAMAVNRAVTKRNSSETLQTTKPAPKPKPTTTTHKPASQRIDEIRDLAAEGNQ